MNKRPKDMTAEEINALPRGPKRTKLASPMHFKDDDAIFIGGGGVEPTMLFPNSDGTWYRRPV